MSHAFTPGQGFFVREPSWHQLEKAVLDDWPGSYKEAAVIAAIDEGPVSEPVYVKRQRTDEDGTIGYLPEYVPLEGYQRIARADGGQTHSVQATSYRMVPNPAFGDVIETVLGVDIGAPIKFEGLFELYGGAKVFAVVMIDENIAPSADTSKVFPFAVFNTDHTGNGGLRCKLTKVRVVCANTDAAAESGVEEERTAWSIRHTANWDERVADVREALHETLNAARATQEAMEELSMVKVTPKRRETFLRRFLPIGDDMSALQMRYRENEREAIRTILRGPTCQGIDTTAYGLYQAATEWVDHGRRFKSQESYVTRQLVAPQPLKHKALKLARSFS